MIEDEFFSDEESFQEWLFFASDVLEIFLEDFKELQLDYSSESLIRVEKWILQEYKTPEDILSENEKYTLDSLTRYVGEVYRRNLNGKWNLKLDDPSYAYYGVPLIEYINTKIPDTCPLYDITASIDRRGENYIYNLFVKKKNKLLIN
jgi:hypothetical protein